MKAIKIGKNKWRKYGFKDWVRENVLGISCVMLTVYVVFMAVKIISAY